MNYKIEEILELHNHQVIDELLNIEEIRENIDIDSILISTEIECNLFKCKLKI